MQNVPTRICSSSNATRVDDWQLQNRTSKKIIHHCVDDARDGWLDILSGIITGRIGTHGLRRSPVRQPAIAYWNGEEWRDTPCISTEHWCSVVSMSLGLDPCTFLSLDKPSSGEPSRP